MLVTTTLTGLRTSSLNPLCTEKRTDSVTMSADTLHDATHHVRDRGGTLFMVPTTLRQLAKISLIPRESTARTFTYRCMLLV